MTDYYHGLLVLLGHKVLLPLSKIPGAVNLVDMDGVRARIQTVEEIYELVWTAVESKWTIEAMYRGRLRLFCPHRLGRNRDGQLRVLCYQYGGESKSGLQLEGSPANWRCIELERLSRVKLLKSAWHTAPNHSRPGSCVVAADIDVEDHRARDPQKGH